MSKKHSTLVKKQFESEYGYYDDFIKKVVPGYEKIHKIVIKLLNYPKKKKLRILDLGIGTGKTAKAILDKFPNATIDGYDISPNMMSVAKNSLKEYKNRVNFTVEDIKDISFTEKYDSCVSVLAIHHLDANEKKELYKKIFLALNSKGIFINGDKIKQETEKEETKKKAEWKSVLIKNLGEKVGLEKFKLFEKEDIPDTFSDQLNWLKQAGFKEIRRVWNYSIYAVFFGKKE